MPTTPDGLTLPDIVMSFKQAAICVRLGGWPAAQEVTCLAVSAAESSLNCTAVQKTYECYGVMQVRKPAHPQLFAALSSDLGWVEPATNYGMALKVYQGAGGSWDPWESYTKARHRLFIPQAKAAFAQVDHDTALMTADQKTAYYKQQLGPVWAKVWAAANLGGAVGAIGDVATGSGDALVDVGGIVAGELDSWMSILPGLQKLLAAVAKSATWISVGYVLGGALLVGIVLFGLVKSSSVGKTAAAVAMKVV